ncbi:MAG: hypothetical protein J7J38_01295 [Candidatus Aenigmarchaeota archaeon]|nr:hypothetical protein [Candidatus Aenigmarchaeota archaeon]
MKPRIEKIEFGNIIIDGKKYEGGDLIISWDGVEEVDKTHFISEERFRYVLSKKPDAVIISTGFYDCVKIDKKIKEIADNKNIKLFVLPTPEACKKFNELKTESVAIIHLTC